MRVLITRPEHQQAELSEAVSRLDGVPVSLPLIEIEPIGDATSLGILREQVQHLDQYQLLIFVSSNAARFGGELIDAHWPQFPAGVEAMAIGPATTRELRRRLDCKIQTAAGRDSEALLALPRLGRVGGERVAIFRGRGGRELLAETLRARGARVDYFEVYTRRPCDHEPGALARLLDDPGVDAVTVTSGESIQYLVRAAGENKTRLSLLPLVVPSARVANLADQAGFSRVINAGGADQAALVAALQRIAAGADNKA